VSTYLRSWALDDIAVRSGGDGRTVEAYAAVFDTPAEIHDQHGHYLEVIDRSAFTRTLSHGIDRIGVYYHHGMTLHGTPSDLGAVPIGSPVEVRPDGRGLRTVTRFNHSALADGVLEAIRAGDIKGYSFRGRIFQSNPARVPRVRTGDPLPTVTRTELGCAEYGPTPTPAYDTAAVLAVRSADRLAHDLAVLDEDERAELLRILSATTPTRDPVPATATPAPGPGAEDSHAHVHSGRLAISRARLRVEMISKGVLSRG
jgi:HK97 family phage prohead protease